MTRLHRRFTELIATKDEIVKELSPSGKWEDMAKAMRSDRYVAAEKAAEEFLYPCRFFISVLVHRGVGHMRGNSRS